MEECNCLNCEERTLRELYEEHGAEILEQCKHKEAKRVVKKEKDNSPSDNTIRDIEKLAYRVSMLENVLCNVATANDSRHIMWIKDLKRALIDAKLLDE